MSSEVPVYWDDNIRVHPCLEHCIWSGVDDANTCENHYEYTCLCAPGVPEAIDVSDFNSCLSKCPGTWDTEDTGYFQGLCDDYPFTSSGVTTSVYVTTLPVETPTDNPDAPSSTPGNGRSIPSEDSDSGEGFSVGMQIGIGVGVGIAVVVVLLVAFLFRGRIRQRFSKVTGKTDDAKTPRMSELEGGTPFPDVRSSTKDDPYLGELDSGTAGAAKATPTEMDMRPHSQFTELDGSSSPRVSSRPEWGEQGGGTTPAHLASTRATASEVSLKPPDPNTDMDPRPSTSAATADDVPEPGSDDELDRLVKLDEDLQERRRTLQDLRTVQDRQSAIRERIEELKAQRDSSA